MKTRPWDNINSTTATCASGDAPALSIAKMLKAIKSFPAAPQQRLYMHPANVAAFEKGVEPVDRLYSVPVYVSGLLPERNLQDRWFPPEGDRFCEYGPEDEHWMRPLGLGTVKTIDMGPVIFAIQENVMRKIERQIFDVDCFA